MSKTAQQTGKQKYSRKYKQRIKLQQLLLDNEYAFYIVY